MEKLRFTIVCAIALGAFKPVALGQAPADATPEVPLVAEEPKILDKDARLTFSFRYQPWQEVLDWFAEQAGLSLVFETLPPGTFNYNDTRSVHAGRGARRAQQRAADQRLHASA